jgi:hypothetical protein
MNNAIITETGTLVNGYDYTNQAWVMNGKYVRCGHPDAMDCDCYGKEHEGETCEVRGDGRDA